VKGGDVLGVLNLVGKKMEQEDNESNGLRDVDGVVFMCCVVVKRTKSSRGKRRRRSTDNLELRRGWVYVSQT